MSTAPSNLSRIKFACRFELAFFLSQFNPNLYSHVLKYIDLSSLNTVDALSTALDIYFTDEQKTDFMRFFHFEENFRRLQFKELAIDALDVFLCFEMPDIRGERAFDFIRATCEKGSLSESIKACILDEARCYHLYGLLYRIELVGSAEEQKSRYVVQLLKEYVGTDWLIQKKSELLRIRDWAEIASKFFETKEEFERFRQENLQVQTTSKSSVNSYSGRLFPSRSSGAPSTGTSNMQYKNLSSQSTMLAEMS